MINDNIVITIVEAKNGQCKIAIDADRDVKIYREEIYYQIKLANLVGKNADVNAVNSVSSIIRDNKSKINNEMQVSSDASEIEFDESQKAKKITIKKQNNTDL